jgi:hypothetical protein
VEHRFSSRASGAALVADLESDNRDVFLDLGTISDVIENLSERMNTYAAQLPKQARWHAELLLTEMAGAHNVDGTFEDLHEVATAARRATDLVGDMPGLFRAERDVVLGTGRDIFAAERQALLANVQSQRVQTLEYFTAERLAVLAAVREERMSLLAALHQERIETLSEAETIETRALDSALAGLQDLVDYTLWRVALLAFCLMMAAAAIGVIAYRLAVGGRRGAVTS